MALILGLDEDGVRGVELDHFAQVHVGREIGHAGRLLHIVGDDQDGDLILEIRDEFLDAGRGNRVQRRRGLVEQQDLGFGGQRPRNTKRFVAGRRRD